METITLDRMAPIGSIQHTEEGRFVIMMSEGMDTVEGKLVFKFLAKKF